MTRDDTIFFHQTPRADACEHDWSGNEDLHDEDGRVCGNTTACVKCGMTAFEHSMRYSA